MNEICNDKSCEIKNCNLRHPKICKFYRDYRMCKFGEWCYFLHSEIQSIDTKSVDDLKKDFNEKNEEIKRKMKEIDEKIVAVQKEELETIKKLENIFNSKFETLENTIVTLKKCLSEKDDYISSFETRLKNLEEKNENVKKTGDSENIKMASKDEIVLKCPSCDFTNKSKHGLKIHIQRMHTDLNFSKTCSLCDKTFNTYNKFRDHKFEHTKWNKKANSYSCKECKFIGNNMHTHEVHMGKCHSSNHDCGLCDRELGNLGDLEVHINTCEIYKCRTCGHKEKTVSDIKKHANLLHDGCHIDHLKLSRNNKEEVSEKTYWHTDL